MEFAVGLVAGAFLASLVWYGLARIAATKGFGGEEPATSEQIDMLMHMSDEEREDRAKRMSYRRAFTRRHAEEFLEI